MKKITHFLSLLALTLASIQAHAALHHIEGDFLMFTPFMSEGLPATALYGSYDDVTGEGSWSVRIHMDFFGLSPINYDQTFAIDAITGMGVLDDPTNCYGDDSGCVAFVSNLAGPVQAGEFCRSTLEDPGDCWFTTWTVSTSFGDVRFRPVPVPAAAWLFGSSLLALTGLRRKRFRG